jgi:hypothetical protein
MVGRICQHAEVVEAPALGVAINAVILLPCLKLRKRQK